MDKRTSYEVLEDKLASTKSARFNAYRRLKRQDTLSNWSLTLSSLALLLVSIQGIYPLDFFQFVTPGTEDKLGVLFSLLVLVIALMEQGKSYGVNAEHMHYSAKLVNGLYSELRLLKDHKKGSELEGGLKSIAARYHEHINGCGVNHLPKDCDNVTCSNCFLQKIWGYLQLDFCLYYLVILGFAVFTLSAAFQF